MVTVGLMFAFIGLANMIWNQQDAHTMPAVLRRATASTSATCCSRGTGSSRSSSRSCSRSACASCCSAPGIGVAMRAVVDNRELAALGGARSALLSSFAWALGCSLAALAGILLAPETADMSTTDADAARHHRVLGGGGRPAPQPAAHVPRRADPRAVDPMGGLVPEVLRPVDERARRAADDHAVHRPAAPAARRDPIRADQLDPARSSASRRCATPSIGMAALVVFIAIVSCVLVEHRSHQHQPHRARDVHRARRALARAAHRLGRAGLAGAARVRWASVRSPTPRLGGEHGSIWAVFFAALVTVPIGALLAFPAMRLQGPLSRRWPRWRSPRWSKRCSSRNRLPSVRALAT